MSSVSIMFRFTYLSMLHLSHYSFENFRLSGVSKFYHDTAAVLSQYQLYFTLLYFV